jgi:threonine dehydratase
LNAPGRGDVEAAARVIAGHVHETPVLVSRTLDALAGCEVFFKSEVQQKVGAFKARGACHAVMSASSTLISQGVATHSSGNHGAALAWAARLRQVPAYVVVPNNASSFKRAAIDRYGATIIECGPALADRESALDALVASTGAHVVPPYDDARIIAGQGTVALEMERQVPGLESLWIPVGGGGLAAGCIAALSASSIRVIGAEPELASDAAASMRLGSRQPQMPPLTLADGLRTSLGVLNFDMFQAYGLTICLVSEAEIKEAQRELMSILKVLVEPSSAVPWAALRRYGSGGASRVGIVLTGGNIDQSAPA